MAWRMRMSPNRGCGVENEDTAVWVGSATSTVCTTETSLVFSTTTVTGTSTCWGWQAARIRLTSMNPASSAHFLLLSISLLLEDVLVVRRCVQIMGIEFGRTAEQPPPFTKYRRT